MRINMARIGSKISQKVPRIRFLRSWRGYPVGAVISPPGAMRQILLQAKDQLGNKVAEIVDEHLDPVIGDIHGDPTVEAEGKDKAVVSDGSHPLRLPGKRKSYRVD